MVKDDGRCDRQWETLVWHAATARALGFRWHSPKLPEASNRAADPVTVKFTAGPLQLEKMVSREMLNKALQAPNFAS